MNRDRPTDPSVTDIEGDDSKQFRIYRTDINNDAFECEAGYDTIAEVLGHKFRMDKHYKIRAGRQWLTKREFEDWAKQQPAPPSE